MKHLKIKFTSSCFKCQYSKDPKCLTFLNMSNTNWAQARSSLTLPLRYWAKRWISSRCLGSSGLLSINSCRYRVPRKSFNESGWLSLKLASNHSMAKVRDLYVNWWKIGENYKNFAWIDIFDYFLRSTELAFLKQNVQILLINQKLTSIS